jgi:hypothetical protein
MQAYISFRLWGPVWGPLFAGMPAESTRLVGGACGPRPPPCGAVDAPGQPPRAGSLNRIKGLDDGRVGGEDRLTPWRRDAAQQGAAGREVLRGVREGQMRLHKLLSGLANAGARASRSSWVWPLCGRGRTGDRVPRQARPLKNRWRRADSPYPQPAATRLMTSTTSVTRSVASGGWNAASATRSGSAATAVRSAKNFCLLI